MSKNGGFTLVEVMIAIVVVGLALPAVLAVFYTQADGAAYLRDKSVAQYVAANRLAETRLLQARNDTVFQGRRSGVTTLTGRDWYWWMESEPTEVEDFFRVEIRVARDEDRRQSPLATLVAFTAARGAGESDG